MKQPAPEVAIADMMKAGEELAGAIRSQLDFQVAADTILREGIDTIIGSPNPRSPGRNHSFTSAEEAVKEQAEWQTARREVVMAEAWIEDRRANFLRAQLVARLSVSAAEYRAAKGAA